MQRKSARVEGFTLVEVMVALAVVAIALPALLFSITEQLQGIHYMRDKSMAHWVAMNRMSELNLQNQYVDQYLPKKKKTGSDRLAEREWFWALEVHKTPNESVMRVDIAVRLDKDSKSKPLVTLSNYYEKPSLAPAVPNVPAPGRTN